MVSSHESCLKIFATKFRHLHWYVVVHRWYRRLRVKTTLDEIVESRFSAICFNCGVTEIDRLYRFICDGWVRMSNLHGVKNFCCAESCCPTYATGSVPLTWCYSPDIAPPQQRLIIKNSSLNHSNFMLPCYIQQQSDKRKPICSKIEALRPGR